MRTLAVLSALLIVCALAACTGPAHLVSVRIQTPTTTLAVGQSFQLNATAVYADKSELDVTNNAQWQSPESAYVVVTPKGMVTGLNPGNGIVKVTYFGVSSETRFTVQ